MQPITVLIAEDHQLVREAWQVILESNPRFTVLGSCASGEEIIELSKRLQPNIILMDINLQGLNGIQATPLVLQVSPGTKVIGLSMHTEISYVKEILRKGALGYITKNSSAAEIFRAIEEVFQNKRYLCEEVRNELSNKFTESPDKKRFGTLSLRELEIIDYIKKGCSSKEIGVILNLSSKTVDQHRYNILKKLNVRNTAALINRVNQTVSLTA